MRKQIDDTPSFDFDATSQDVTTVSREQLPVRDPDVASTWNEVPAARFLSWSPAMQAAYCRDRDLDSAEHAENDEWRQFYLQRAERYV